MDQSDFIEKDITTKELRAIFENVHSAMQFYSASSEEYIQYILSTALKCLGGDNAMVGQLVNNEYKVIGFTGVECNIKKGSRFNLEDTLCKKCMRDNKTFFVDDVEGYDGIKSYIGTPLKYGHEIIGSLNVTFKEKKADGFSTLDQEIIELLRTALSNYLKNIQDDTEIERSRSLASEVTRLYAINEMAQAVAYEINNPLMIISGYAKKLMKNSVNPNYKEVKKDVGAIEKSSERISSIVRTLLNYSYGPEKFSAQTIVFNDLVNSAVDSFSSVKKDYSVTIDYVPGDDAKISVNPILVEQAIYNLLNHVAEVSKNTNNKTVNLEFRKHRGRTELILKDSGKKIPEEVQVKMFYNAFATTESDEKKDMGLSSAFNIAKKYKGDLYYDNSYEQNAYILSFNELME